LRVTADLCSSGAACSTDEIAISPGDVKKVKLFDVSSTRFTSSGNSSTVRLQSSRPTTTVIESFRLMVKMRGKFVIQERAGQFKNSKF